MRESSAPFRLHVKVLAVFAALFAVAGPLCQNGSAQEGGDLYIAVRPGEGPRPGVRFSLRFQGGTEQLGADNLAPARASLAFALAEEIFGELGGVLRIEADGRDGVVLGTLPAQS